MASISTNSRPPILLCRIPSSIHLSPSILYFPSFRKPFLHPRFCALKTGSNGGRLGNQDPFGPDLLRKPVVSPVDDDNDDDNDESTKKGSLSDLSDHDVEGKKTSRQREEDEWVDWEDQILEDTVPLVGFVRMILHSEKYESGQKLSAEHQKTILERLLPHHPEFEKKIGCGIDYITVGYHPDFANSRCLFIVRKDGVLEDFSYWKCIKGLIKKNYPLYADSFILRHFRRRKHNE